MFNSSHRQPLLGCAVHQSSYINFNDFTSTQENRTIHSILDSTYSYFESFVFQCLGCRGSPLTSHLLKKRSSLLLPHYILLMYSIIYTFILKSMTALPFMPSRTCLCTWLTTRHKCNESPISSKCFLSLHLCSKTLLKVEDDAFSQPVHISVLGMTGS